MSGKFRILSFSSLYKRNQPTMTNGSGFFYFLNSMIDEVLNCVCRSIIARANCRGAISVKRISWMGSFSFQGSSVFLSSQFLYPSPPNHVTHPGEELHPCSALQQTGDLSSRGRWFPPAQRNCSRQATCCRSPTLRNICISGFPSVCGWTDQQWSADIHQESNILLPSGNVQRSKQYLHKDIISTTGWAKRALHQ